MAIIGCNYVEGQAFVVGMMSLAFFGKGIGALGWAVVSDTSPKEAGGLTGALFNTFGNLAGITTPIVIGYIVERHRLVRRRAGVRRRQRAGRGDRLPLRRRRDQAGEARCGTGSGTEQVKPSKLSKSHPRCSSVIASGSEAIHRAANSKMDCQRTAYTAVVPKISKTTPCKVARRSLACAIPRRHFDTSGKSPVILHHPALSAIIPATPLRYAAEL